MRTVLLAAFAFALAACGDDGQAPTPQTLRTSCDTKATQGQCAHYAFTGDFAAQGVENVKANCPDAGGTVGVTCDPAGAVGKCTTVSGAATIEVWYYPPIFSAGTAKATCEQFGGVWAGA